METIITEITSFFGIVRYITTNWFVADYLRPIPENYYLFWILFGMFFTVTVINLINRYFIHRKVRL